MVTISVPSTSSMSMTSPNKALSFWREIHDPQSKFVNYYNHFLLFAILFSLYLDAFYLYLPMIINSAPMTLDRRLGFRVSLVRVIVDAFLFSGVVLRFRTAYEAPSSRVFGKRELVKMPMIIALRYLKSGFIIDVFSSLPLPQVFLGYKFLALKVSQATKVYRQLVKIILAQFGVKLLRVFSLHRKIENFTGIAIRNPWSGALYILFVYGMISHFFGALYYFAYIVDLVPCNNMEFPKEAKNHLFRNCFQNGTESDGLLSDAYANDIVSRSFSQKFMFCFSWGLKTLSSMGQNINSNSFIVDNIVNLIAIILGLILFADLIARMQTCMQSVGEEEEQQMIRQKELDEWVNHHQLPACLKKCVQQTIRFQFHATNGIDEEAILDSLPLDLRCEIRRYLYSGLIRTLPVFEVMDEQILHAVCGHLRAFSAAEGMLIMLEGEPVRQIVFIFSGQLEICSIDGGSSRCVTVGPGGFCGQELVAWCSPSSTSTQKLPPSTCSVKCLTHVEAFSLRAQDVKLLEIQLNYDQKFFDVLSHHFS